MSKNFAQRISRSEKAVRSIVFSFLSQRSSYFQDVWFSVSRVENHLRRGRYADRIGSTTPVYLAGVLQYLVAEVMELSGNVTKRSRRKRINNRDIFLAIQNDDELVRRQNFRQSFYFSSCF